MIVFEGSGVALVTPFSEDGSINYDKLRELIEFHIENSTDALIIAGTTGEASTLSDIEYTELLKRSVEYSAGKIKVIAGVGSNNTAHAVYLAREAENAGVDALLVVTPYYNKSNDLGFIKHYEAIADCVEIPIILYNVPGRTGVNLPLSVIEYLSKNEKIVGIKEASGDMTYVSDIARICGHDFSIYSGNDDITVPILSIGGKGVISVIANIMPKETHNMVKSYLDGDVIKSREIQLKMNGLVHSLFIEANPIPIKMAMNLLGFNVERLRLPLYNMSPEGTEVLKGELKKMGYEV